MQVLALATDKPKDKLVVRQFLNAPTLARTRKANTMKPGVTKLDPTNVGAKEPDRAMSDENSPAMNRSAVNTRGAKEGGPKSKVSKRVSFGEFVEKRSSDSGEVSGEPRSILRARGSSVTKSGKSLVSDEADGRDKHSKADDRSRLAEEFKIAIENALQATDGGGVVHLSEYYEDDAKADGLDEPKSVEISGMRGVCNHGVDFGENSTEYLDISSARKGEQRDGLLDNWQKRKALLDELAEAEDALERIEIGNAEDNKSDTNKSYTGDHEVQNVKVDKQAKSQQGRKKKTQSRDTFGSGFSRGFFNAPDKSRSTCTVKGEEREQLRYDVDLAKSDSRQEGILPVPVVTSEKEAGLERGQTCQGDRDEMEDKGEQISAVSDDAVGERITKSRRRRRLQRSARTLRTDRVEGVYGTSEPSGTDNNNHQVNVNGEEIEDIEISRPISRFMQMRMAQRSSK